MSFFDRPPVARHLAEDSRTPCAKEIGYQIPGYGDLRILGFRTPNFEEDGALETGAELACARENVGKRFFLMVPHSEGHEATGGQG